MKNQVKNDEIRQAVREQYSKVAEGTACGSNSSSCCGTSTSTVDSISQEMGYSEYETCSVPEGTNLGLGCGNPQAIANLKAGEVVVDLGSGAGFDCFLASKQVGNEGHIIGVDMTPTMISKARLNAEKGQYTNTEFRLGEIENLPVADNTIDVIISNCVINLSPDKEKVFKECYRVLKTSGRLAISDVVAFAEIPDEIRNDITLFTGCMAGASLITELKDMLHSAGFELVRVTPKDESKKFISKWAPGTNVTDFVVSANIEAYKIPQSCCSPTSGCC
jgi:ubiquinone/menaquinone biosynthesis C-methylase UbiE/bacterioferritin-associated ferredoxin